MQHLQYFIMNLVRQVILIVRQTNQNSYPTPMKQRSLSPSLDQIPECIPPPQSLLFVNTLQFRRSPHSFFRLSCHTLPFRVSNYSGWTLSEINILATIHPFVQRDQMLSENVGHDDTESHVSNKDSVGLAV